MARRRSNGLLEIGVRVEMFEGLDLSEVSRRLSPALKRLANEIRDEAKASAAFHDETGNLRRSIRVRKSRFDDDSYIVIAGGTKKAKHAHLVEFGHAMVTHDGHTVGHVPARPFLRPARDKVLGRALEVIRASVD